MKDRNKVMMLGSGTVPVFAASSKESRSNSEMSGVSGNDYQMPVIKFQGEVRGRSGVVFINSSQLQVKSMGGRGQFFQSVPISS